MVFYSPIEFAYFLLPLAGFVIGLFGTMLGGGGGFFFLPILTIILGVPAQTAVITSLVATLPICFIGTIKHRQQGNVNTKVGIVFSMAGIIGALLGAYITSLISADQLKTGFGIYSILIALNVIVSTWIKSSSNKKQHRTINKIKGSFYGLFAGLITGVFGTSGTAPILAGLFTMNISVKTVIGTSLFVVLVNTLFAIGGHLFVGKLDLTLVGFLSIGSIIGALVGPFWVSKAKTDNSESKIKYIYALVIVAIGVIMIMD